MDSSQVAFKEVLYFVDKFVITAGSSTFDIPRQMIHYFDIYKDYYAEIYPMWYVKCNVPNWFYSEMVNHYDEVYVTLSLQYRFGVDRDTITSETGSYVTELAGKFKAVIPYTSPVPNSTIQVQYEKENDTYKKNYDINEYSMVEMSLYNTNAYKASFDSQNAVLSSANLTTASAYLFTKAGISNVLMDKPDNMTTYSEFKVLPMSTVKNLLRIIDTFNLHKSGTILHFDLDTTYYLGDKVGCHCWRNNEHKSTQIICLSDYADSYGNSTGILVDTKNKTTMVQIRADSIESLDNAKHTPITRGIGFDTFLRIRTTSAIMSAFTPNKEFIVNIDSPSAKSINGKYSIALFQCRLEPEGEFFKPNCIIELKR